MIFVWLTWLSITIFRSIHVTANGFIMFLWLSNIPLCLCTTSLPIHLSVVIYIASMSWLLWTVRQWTRIGCMYTFELWFSLGLYPGVGSPNHMVAPFLIFKIISRLFSIVAVTIYFPTSSVGVFPFLYTLSSIYCL